MCVIILQNFCTIDFSATTLVNDSCEKALIFLKKKLLDPYLFFFQKQNA